MGNTKSSDAKLRMLLLGVALASLQLITPVYAKGQLATPARVLLHCCTHPPPVTPWYPSTPPLPPADASSTHAAVCDTVTTCNNTTSSPSPCAAAECAWGYTDDTSFSDAFGDCDAYKDNMWCESGHAGWGWNPSWGELSDAVAGACCVCGSGKRGAPSPPPPPPTLRSGPQVSLSPINSPPGRTTTLRITAACFIILMPMLSCVKINFNGTVPLNCVC